jgi:type VI secretion system protein ImpB
MSGISNISIQRVLQRIRPPRVRISYDVHIGNATEKKELPFVVGVMGDFSGDPTQPLKSLADRSFIEISRDNFDTVMTRMTPGLNLRVKNTLEDDGTEIAVQLKFQSMKDFEPARIIDQIKPLKELMEARQKLLELKTKVDLAPNLENRLQELLTDPDKLKRVASETAIAGKETNN